MRSVASPPLGPRRHLLLTQQDRAKLPPLYSTENTPLDQKMLLVKFFTPFSNWTWWATEFDGEDTFFGLVRGFEEEWGYFSLSELEGVTGPGGMPAVERDKYWRPITYGELKANPHLGTRVTAQNYLVQKMLTPPLGEGDWGPVEDEWGVWSEQARDYVAYFDSRLDADEAAARWNRNPMLAPDHSQFHDPTMFGTRPQAAKFVPHEHPEIGEWHGTARDCAGTMCTSEHNPENQIEKAPPDVQRAIWRRFDNIGDAAQVTGPNTFLHDPHNTWDGPTPVTRHSENDFSFDGWSGHHHFDLEGKDILCSCAKRANKQAQKWWETGDAEHDADHVRAGDGGYSELRSHLSRFHSQVPHHETDSAYDLMSKHRTTHEGSKQAATSGLSLQSKCATCGDDIYYVGRPFNTWLHFSDARDDDHEAVPLASYTGADTLYDPVADDPNASRRDNAAAQLYGSRGQGKQAIVQAHVQIFLNEAPWADKFNGYKSGHPLTPVFSYMTESKPDLQVCEEAFRLFNVGDDPAFGTPDERAQDYRAGRNRSLSVGDIVVIDYAKAYSCEDVGFKPVEGFTASRTANNPYVPSQNPYTPEEAVPPGTPDEMLDGPLPPPPGPEQTVSQPQTTKPRQMPSGGAEDAGGGVMPARQAPDPYATTQSSKVAMPLTPQQQSEFETLWRRALEAGQATYDAADPQRVVVQQHADPLNDASPVVWSDTNQGRGYELEGFASVHFKGNTPFGRWAKARGYVKSHSYYGGLYFWVPGRGYERRYSFARAMADVLKQAGIDAWADSRLD